MLQGPLRRTSRGAQSQDFGALEQDANTPQPLTSPRRTPEIWHRASLWGLAPTKGQRPHVSPPGLDSPRPDRALDRAAGTNRASF